MSVANLRISIAACISVICVASAIAADIAQPEPLPIFDPAPATSADWSGFYFGGSLMAATSYNFDEANSNLGVGFQAGYLQQYGSFVMGGELQATLNDNIYYGLSSDAGVVQGWSAAAKIRAGFAVNDLLLYGTGGLGISRFRPSGSVVAAEDHTVGATIGAGLEYFVTETVSLRGEYLHTIYNDFRSNASGVERSDRLVTNAVHLGVSNHF